MNIEEAAEAMVPLIMDMAENEDNPKADKGHLIYMAYCIIDGKVVGEKAHRWLGYIQGVMVCRYETTVEEMKQLNKASK
jgi:hypothetical protein